jgi:hypothetical protein
MRNKEELMEVDKLIFIEQEKLTIDFAGKPHVSIPKESYEWLIKTIKEQRLDIKALSQDVNRLSNEAGKSYTKLHEIKEIMNRP